MLSYFCRGSLENPPLVFLHGFLGCKEDFVPLVSKLETNYYCICLDLPGHGSSVMQENALESIVSTLSHLNITSTDFVGYSMGGRICLELYQKYPTLYKKMIILSSHPGLKNQEEKDARWQEDLKWVDLLENRSLDEFLNAWYEQPLFAHFKKTGLFANVLKRRQKQNPNGLAEMLKTFSLAKQDHIIPPSALFLYGEEDLKYETLYRTLLKENQVKRISKSEHPVHLQNPEECATMVQEFLEKECIEWTNAGSYQDIKYEKHDGIAKITINRPHVRNAFTPLTVDEMSHALNDARMDAKIGVVILTGEGRDAFCSGGDQRIRGDAGYSDNEGVERLNVLDFQKQIRSCPKPIIAMIAGYAIGGGHVLHVMCDLSIAAEHSIFGQVGPKVGSFDGGFGASYLSRIVGQKKAREIWYLCRRYTAKEALEMGLVNHVVPYEELESTTVAWAKEMLQHSPLALRCLKSAFNADCDGQAGIQELAGNATLLYYMTEEAQEGKTAFLEKRAPDFSQFPKRP